MFDACEAAAAVASTSQLSVSTMTSTTSMLSRAIEECSPAEAADAEMDSAGSEQSRESTVAMQGDESSRSSGEPDVDVDGPSDAPPLQSTCTPFD